MSRHLIWPIARTEVPGAYRLRKTTPIEDSLHDHDQHDADGRGACD